MFGGWINFPLPFVPGVKWGLGVYVTHPWLEPVAGKVWDGASWAVEKGRRATVRLSDAFATRFPGSAERLVRGYRATKTFARKQTQRASALASTMKQSLEGFSARVDATLKQISQQLRQIVF